MSDRPERSRHRERRRGIWLTVVIVLLFIGLLVGSFIYVQTQPRGLSDADLRARGVFLFERPRDVGEFTLIDDNGQPFSEEALAGQWSLLFFGFTYCPDICPTTLAQLADFYRRLDPELKQDTRVMLVSVDPARDTPEKLHDYVRYFHPEFRGLTGEFLELHRVATAFNIPFTKQRGAGENYLVEHSANVVLVNDRGHYVGFIKGPIDVEQLLLTYEAVRSR